MCGRITLKSPAQLVAEEFQLAHVPELIPRYNIAPTQPVLAVLLDSDGRRTPRALKWGLVPPWSRDPRNGAKMFNARGETVMEKPAFREAFAHRRCLIPVDGFYEWRKQGRERLPLYFHAGDDRLLALAGLWEHWEYPGGEVIESCSILTTAANDLMRPIHHRMPVILDRASREPWLRTPPDAAAALLPLLQPAREGWLAAHPVASLVNKPANDGPELIVPQHRTPPGQLNLFS